MSADGSIELPFGDGQQLFRLAIGQWRELAEIRKLGPKRLFERVRAGDWFVDDLYQVMRLGLIGGGMSPPDALRLTDLYFKAWPLLQSEQICLAVMAAALVGMEGESVGKAEAGEATTTSASPAPTETPSRPATRRQSRSTA